MGERGDLQLIAEGFNIFNRLNYASVNNIVGPSLGLPTTIGGQGFTTFNVKGSAQPFISNPLAFTSAYPARQLQLGLRANF
jgi:hypothetical protein